MAGRPRIEWFEDSFLGSQPLVYVPSYRRVRDGEPEAP
jgi:hypothetical protein